MDEPHTSPETLDSEYSVHLPDDIVTIDSDSNDSVVVLQNNISLLDNWLPDVVRNYQPDAIFYNEPSIEPLNLSLDAPSDLHDSRSSLPEEIPELPDFWHGTLRNLQNALANSSNMTDAISRSPSTEPQDLPLQESPPGSPYSVTEQYSPAGESGQSTPVQYSGRSSPMESGENSAVESGRTTPVEYGGISPPHEPIRLTLRRVTRRNSLSQESGHGSPLGEDQSIYVAEPPTKIRKLNSPKAEDENDGETCPICLDSWSNTGEHRLVALKCGHLFGSSCIERWITAKNTNERCCPTCKMRASIKDIRFIYAKKLVAVDMREMTALQQHVQTVELQKNQIQMELKATKNEYRLMMEQMQQMKEAQETSAVASNRPSRHYWRFALDKNLEVWRDGGCRVLEYNCRTYEFYVSQKTTNTLFPGYGVRPVSCIDYKLGPFIPLHPKAIRDVAYSQPTDLLMSVGLDGAVKIVERGIPTTSIQCKMPLWSCAWDHGRPNNFHVGAVGGSVMSYDVRNTGAVLETMSTQGDMSPIVSLVSTEFGLLSCQLNSAWLWRSTASGMIPQQLPLNGPFSSLCYDEDTQRLAVSCRPKQTGRAKVVLYHVKRTDYDGISFRLLENVIGSSRSTVMSRAAFVKCANSSWVASYSESDSALLLHPIDRGRTMTLPASEPALDVCAAVVNGETILASLSETRLKLYRSHQIHGYY